MVKITIEGDLSTIELTDREFVHAGGEGSVYVKGEIAFKIYHDENKMMELGRLQELKSIQGDNIVKPEKVIYNLQGKAIGYTMRALNDVWALTRLFNKSFRNKQGITDETMSKLVQRMRETYASLHEQGFLVTDGNELNFLVSEDFKEIYFIDVDAFKTPSFPSRAYNESTLDPNIADSLEFTQSSDWFAYGVVAFQMLVGTHPFKGIYEGTQYKFAKNDIVNRIKRRISCFNPDVRLARPIVPIESLPAGYFDWFSAIFETDVRLLPPETFGGIATAKKIVAKIVSSVLKVQEIASFSDNVLGVYTNGLVDAVKTESAFVINGQAYPYQVAATEIVFLPVSNTPVLVRREQGAIALMNTATSKANIEEYGLKDLFVFDNRVYGVTGNSLLEFSFRETSKGITIMAETIETILPGTVMTFDGVVIENLMGGTHASLLIGEGQCAKVHLKEFDGKRIVNARYQNHILAIVWYDKGNYTKSIFKFDRAFRGYSQAFEESIESPDINMAVLDQGVCISMSENNSFKIFSNHATQSEVKELEDKSISGDVRLFNQGTRLQGLSGHALVGFSMS